jgi:polysaccharide pyruvyl transferase WcaK-like protein
MKNARHIALLGPYGFGNLGDAAIQQAVIDALRLRQPGAEIVGISLNPRDTEKRHGIRAYPITSMPPERLDKEKGRIGTILQNLRWSMPGRMAHKLFVRLPKEFFLLPRALVFARKLSMLVISGGGQLDDYWGGPWGHPYALLKWCLAARLNGARVAFMSVGAGPLDASLSKRFARRYLRLAQYRSYRDQASKTFIASIGWKTDDPVYPDLAHGIRVDHLSKTSFGDGKSLVVGVGPMSYFDPRVWPERDGKVYRGYLEKLALFTSWLLGEGHCVVLFPGEAYWDGLVMEDLARLLQNGPDRPGTLQSARTETVDELMSTLKGFDVVVASRFHGVLLAHVVQKPVLALSYHQKITVLMEEMGHGAYNLDIASFDVEELKQRFQDLLANRARLEREIAAKERSYRAQLDEQFDTLFGRAASPTGEVERM